MFSSPAIFSTSYDRTTKIVTTVACAMLLLIVATIQSAVVAILVICVVASALAWSPRSYTVSERSIEVHRLIGTVRIPLDGIREVRTAGADDLRNAIRIFASGGLFGYYGLFQTPKLGRCWWYVTNRRNAVCIITREKTTLLSPDDVDGFLAAVRAAGHIPESPVPQPPAAARSCAAGLSAGGWIGGTVALLVFAAIAFAFLYSPGPPQCTLTPGALTIHDRFYPVTLKAADVSVTEIRVVDLTRDTGWRPTMRTNGFANAHYHSGWFRVANGQNVRMYRANGTRLVLLPLKASGAAVLLEAKQPDAFAEAVRTEWSQR